MKSHLSIQSGTGSLSLRGHGYARIPIPRLIGRPTKRTPERVERIIESLEAGNFLATAFAAANVGQSTGHGWLKQGKEDEEGPFFDFYVKVQRALARGEERTVRQLERLCKKGHFAAIKFKLERRYREEWGPNPRPNPRPDPLNEAPGSEDDGDGRFDLSPLTQEELETLRALLDKASRLDG